MGRRPWFPAKAGDFNRLLESDPLLRIYPFPDPYWGDFMLTPTRSFHMFRLKKNRKYNDVFFQWGEEPKKR